ncbi:MAG: lipid-A-disaccharide synthase N-terminal domain-containing protein [Hyphomicrobium sp.]
MNEALQTWWSTLAARDAVWLTIGLVGQGLFSARWLVQWVASEKSRRSTMPEVFWYLSFLGGLLVLSYGIHKLDPVIILGQFGVLIYARNLFFIRKDRPSDAGVTPAE